MNRETRETIKEKVEKKTRKKGGCLIWQGGAYGGEYPTLWMGGKRYSLRRLVYEAFENEPRLGDKDVRSTCGNPYCVHPDHLIRGTRTKSGRPPQTQNGKK